MPVPAKPCGYCESLTHWPYQCWKNPYLKKFGAKGSKIYKRPNKRGKHALRWERTRKAWFIENPADHYICYLCGKWLQPIETTLDHIKPRSGNPELRYEFSNLAPCCYPCNKKKGSLSLERYREKNARQ